MLLLGQLLVPIVGSLVYLVVSARFFFPRQYSIYREVQRSNSRKCTWMGFFLVAQYRRDFSGRLEFPYWIDILWKTSWLGVFAIISNIYFPWIWRT